MSKIGSVKVVYTKEGEKADCYKEWSAFELSRHGGVTVAISDYKEHGITN